MGNSTDTGTLHLLIAIYALHFTMLTTEGHKMGLIPDSEYKTYIKNGMAEVKSMSDGIADMLASIDNRRKKVWEDCDKNTKN